MNLSLGSRNVDARDATGSITQVVESDYPPTRRLPVDDFSLRASRIGLRVPGL